MMFYLYKSIIEKQKMWSSTNSLPERTWGMLFCSKNLDWKWAWREIGSIRLSCPRQTTSTIACGAPFNPNRLHNLWHDVKMSYLVEQGKIKERNHLPHSLLAFFHKLQIIYTLFIYLTQKSFFSFFIFDITNLLICSNHSSKKDYATWISLIWFSFMRDRN